MSDPCVAGFVGVILAVPCIVGRDCLGNNTIAVSNAVQHQERKPKEIPTLFLYHGLFGALRCSRAVQMVVVSLQFIFLFKKIHCTVLTCVCTFFWLLFHVLVWLYPTKNE